MIKPGPLKPGPLRRWGCLHHAVHHDPIVITKIEHQPSWVHEHPSVHIEHVDPEHYRFTPAIYSEAAFDHFEGRNEVVRPGRLPEIPVTTHANVELPPHVDTGTEAPPPKAVLHI